MEGHEIVVVTEEQVRELLGMKETIEAVEAVFRSYADGKASMMPRQYFFMEEYKGRVGFMPAYVSGTEIVGVKIVAAHKGNPAQHGLPTVQAMTVLTDGKTGVPLAMVAASYATMMRTGAVAAIAARYLSREDARVAGIMGAGVQGVGQLLGLAEVRAIKKALVYDVSKEKRETYAASMSQRLGIQVEPVESGEDLTRHVDILVTATPSPTPVIEDAWLSPGMHINTVGVSTAGNQEIPTETFRRSKCVVDQFEQTSKIGGISVPISKGNLDQSWVYAELGELVTGKKAGRTSPDEITVFVSSGLAIQDIAVASLIYEKAREKRVGSFIEWKP